ncbi:MAG: hypothetical protein R6W31_12545 [Bacteroidales bacterium]
MTNTVLIFMLGFMCTFSLKAQAVFEIIQGAPGPVIGESNVEAENNAYGFEGGKVVKLGSLYCFFYRIQQGI